MNPYPELTSVNGRTIRLFDRVKTPKGRLIAVGRIRKRGARIRILVNCGEKLPGEIPVLEAFVPR